MVKMYPTNGHPGVVGPRGTPLRIDEMGVLVVKQCNPEESKACLVEREKELQDLIGKCRLFTYCGYSFVAAQMVGVYFRSHLALSLIVSFVLVTWFSWKLFQLSYRWNKKLKCVKVGIDEYNRAIEALKTPL
jgi:hypothetical protein